MVLGIAARVDGEVYLAHIVVRSWGSLGSANRTCDVRVAHRKLIVIGIEWTQTTCFDFDGVVNVWACVDFALGDDFGHWVIRCNFVAHTNWSVRWRVHAASSVVDGDWIVQWQNPETVELSSTCVEIGAQRVQWRTEFGYGSPEATPWVKFRFEGACADLGSLRFTSFRMDIPIPGWWREGER
jgi:hypothetical protein